MTYIFLINGRCVGFECSRGQTDNVQSLSYVINEGLVLYFGGITFSFVTSFLVISFLVISVVEIFYLFSFICVILFS